MQVVWVIKFLEIETQALCYEYRKSKQNCLLRTIFVYSDGASRSGLVAAVMHMIDMMKVEQIVDVFLVCRYIIVNRPQAIDDLVSLVHY